MSEQGSNLWCLAQSSHDNQDKHTALGKTGCVMLTVCTRCMEKHNMMCGCHSCRASHSITEEEVGDLD